MENISLRLYMILMAAVAWLRSWAQDGDDAFYVGRQSDDMGGIELEEMMGYSPVHIRFSDILWVIFILVCCYVFSKIWKGCTYLIISLAVVFYILLR